MPDKVVNTVAPGGTSLPMTEADAAALGAQVEHPAVAEQAQLGEQRRRMFGGIRDQVSSFAEGIIDAYSGGLIHEQGEEADLRRESTPGSVLLGEMVGTVLGLKGPGPVKVLSESGEKAGAYAAKQLLRQGEKAIVTSTLREAGAGALIAGENALGHQLVDSMVGDHEFSGEAVLDATKLGGLMGGAGGALMGTVGKLARGANRAEAAVGAEVADMGEALEAHQAARQAYGESLHFYEQQLGAIKELRKAGGLSEVADDFIRVRSDAVRAARNAQKALQDIDVEAALSGSDPAAYKYLQRRMGEYHRAVEAVDDIMRPHPAEMAGAAREDLTKVFTPEDVTAVRPVTGKDDFAIRADRVGEAIPDEAAYLANYPAKVGEGGSAGAAEGTVAGKRMAPESLPPEPNDLAKLDAIIEKLPVRSQAQSEDVLRLSMENLQAAPGSFAREGTEFGASGGKPGIDAAIAKMTGGKNKGQLLESAEQVPTDPYAKLEEAPAAPNKATPPPLPLDELKTKITRPEQADVAKRLLDEWVNNHGTPRVRPWQEAQARAQDIANTMYTQSGGRFDSAKAIGILEKDGIAPSIDPVGSHLDAVYAMNRVARLAADEARGVATPLRDLAKKALGVGTISAVLKMAGIKHNVVFGLLSYSGKLASASGKMAKRITTALDTFLTSTKVRATTIAASNHPWAYSETGPIKDPVARIQEIQMLANNPDAIRARVRRSAGDLASISPDHVAALENAAVRQMQALAVRAPAIYFDKLGRPMQPPGGKMRQFHEFENAVNDLPSVLSAIQSGGVTKPQVEALQVAWPAVYTRMVMGVLQDPQKLQEYSREKLRVVEMLTGMPLTGASDPMFVLRQQTAWQPAAPQAEPAKPQAFNINPTGAPTPSQANASGRAPGNL